MIRKFVTKMTLATVFLLLFSTKFVDVTIGEQLVEYPLETAWKATGLPLDSVSTETWMQLNKRWTPLYELKNIGQQIRRKLDLQLRTPILSGEQSEFTYVSMEGIRGDGTVITVTLQSTRTDNLYETQIGVNTMNNGIIQDLRTYIENLKAKIGALGSAAHFNVVLEGERKGKIAPNLIRDFSGKAFRKIRARVVDSAMQEGNLVQKGYTQLIKETVNYKSDRMNIEINTRYDRARDLTEVIIATPNFTDGV